MKTTVDPESLSPHEVAAQRASVAVGVAPTGVLLAFTGVVSGLVEVDTALAVFAACTAWVAYEMRRYQRLIPTGEQ